MKKVAIITLGCDKNVNDTENLAGVLKKKGYHLESNPAKADAVVVHTCSFIETAKKESIDTILKAAQSKKEKAKLIVTGCMVQQHGKEMMEELPEVDAFLGTGQLGRIPAYLSKPRERFMDRRNPGGFMDPDARRILSVKGKSAYLRLSEGCSHPCSFCVIPKVRGGLQSRPAEKIIREAKGLLSKGVQELALIGQDTGEWGRDLFGKPKLPMLLDKLRRLKGLRWIRLLYMHPKSLTMDILSILSESPVLFPYLDIPLQHIDDQILSDMNREHTEAEARKLLDTIHQKCSGLALRSTFIAGYPGETEGQFSKLNDFINEGHFHYAGFFPYSQEDSTPAGLKEDQLPDAIKQERFQALSATQYNAGFQKAMKRMGTVETALIDDKEEGSLVGRTRWEAPEIDAVVRLNKAKGKVGQTLQVRLTGYDAHEYSGEVVAERKGSRLN